MAATDSATLDVRPDSKRSIGPLSTGSTTLLRKPRSKCAARTESAARGAAEWLKEYLLEWQLTDKRNSSKLKARVDALTHVINCDTDVICFSKPGGV